MTVLAARLLRSGWLVRLSACSRRCSTAILPSPEWMQPLREAANEDKGKVSYDIEIFDEKDFIRAPYKFDSQMWDAVELPTSVKSKICLGDVKKQYINIGEAFSFPDAGDNPVVNSPGNPAKLWWDPDPNSTPKVLVQLGPAFPPALWLPAKPEYDALKRTFREFLEVDATHMKTHLLSYEALQNELETTTGRPLGETDYGQMKDALSTARRKINPATFKYDWDNDARLFLGTVDSFEIAENSFENNPFLFAWPLVLGHENKYCEDKPTKTSIFRTIYSKSIISVTGKEDLATNLLGQAPEEDDKGEEDYSQIPVDVPIFIRINYAPNSRMCGGQALVQRYNKLLSTDFPLDTPVDVLAACLGSVMHGEKRMMRDLQAFTKELVGNPRKDERKWLVTRIAMQITYLATLQFEGWKQQVFEKYRHDSDPSIRIAVAKGCSEMRLWAELNDMYGVENVARIRRLIGQLIVDGTSDLADDALDCI